MSMSIEINWNEMIGRQYENATDSILQDVLENLLEESKTECPFEEGILENSGYTVYDSQKKEGNVIYDTPYAVRLHEHPEYNFKGKGKGKWLERALDRKREEYIRFIAREILRRV